MDHNQALEAYGRAWAQSDEDKVRACIQECWTVDSTYVNPFTDVVQGVEAMTRLIMDYPAIFPDAEVIPSGQPDLHHAFARLPWRLLSTARIRILGKDFGLTLSGTDVVEFDADDKIRRVVAFFDVR